MKNLNSFTIDNFLILDQFLNSKEQDHSDDKKLQCPVLPFQSKQISSYYRKMEKKCKTFKYSERITSFLLSQKFSILQNTNQQCSQVNCHVYGVEIFFEQQLKFQFAIAFPLKFEFIPDFKIVKRVFQLATGWEEVQVKYINYFTIQCNIVELFYKFTIHLMAQLNLISFANYNLNFCQFEDILQGNNNKQQIMRNYLFIPIKNNLNYIEIDFEKFSELIIDWNAIQNIIQWKEFPTQFENLNPNSNLVNQVNNLLQKYSQFEEKFKFEKVKEEIKQKIYCANYGSNATYYILDLYLFPEKQKAIEYLKAIQSFCKNYSLEQLLEFHQITLENANQISINDFLYDYPTNKQIDGIWYFRKNLSCKEKPTILNRNLPLVLVNCLNAVSSQFDYLNPNSQCYNSIKKLPFQLNFPSVKILNSQYLFEIPLSLSTYEQYCKIPSIMIKIEHFIMISEMKLYYNLPVNNKYLIIACQNAQVDSQNNFESLETLGDSILKFVSSAYLYINRDSNENHLTYERMLHIRNSFLSIKGIENDLGNFIYTRTRVVDTYKSPLWINVHPQFDNFKNIDIRCFANIIEGIFGAVFISNYSLVDMLYVFQKFQILITNNLANKNFIIEELILFRPQFCKELNINLHNTYKELFNYCQKSSIPLLQRKLKFQKLNDLFIINQYAQHIAKNKDFLPCLQEIFSMISENLLNGYQFRNVNLLISAFLVNNIFEEGGVKLQIENYERLEFLGDAAFEAFLISNIFFMFEQENKFYEITPLLLNQAKILILSNPFMVIYFIQYLILYQGRMSAFLNLQDYLLNPSQQQQQSILEYLQNVNQNLGFKDFVRHYIDTPKIMADIWESLAGAILIDGGWRGFNQVFGQILYPYMKFFVTYYDQLTTNIYDIWQESIQKKLSLKQNDFQLVEELLNQMPTIEIQSKKKYKASLYLQEKFICSSKGETKKIARETTIFNACKKFNFI